MIRTHALTKRFGSVTAVDNIDLDVREGDVYGFLGANGSGKTTTLRMLLGLVLATSGDAEVLGHPMPASAATVLPEIGALVEGPGAYPYLSGRTNLATIDAVGPSHSGDGRKRRIDDTLDQVGLDPSDHRPVRTYSLGMRQRLGLAAALLRRPRLLVLDEPTNGLDPQGIREIRELLLALHAGGTTVFLSSHLLAEVEQMCTRIGVLERGRLVLQDELATLLAPTGRVVVNTQQTEWAAELLGRRVESISDGRIVVIADDASAVNTELVDAGIPVSQIGPLRHDLEDVVLHATEDG
ncbi:ABC transporter ATP-binding protein [Aeromicrobium sp.]|uniref:ABC transporter ATP-binding protein n=1 Tax=Aeromicrobium sp. TaxID=1871063 RepID=UPI003D6B9AFC